MIAGGRPGPGRAAPVPTDFSTGSGGRHMTGWGNKVVAALVGAALAMAGVGGTVAAQEEARGSELTSARAVPGQEADDGVKAITLRDAIAMALERSTA